MKPLDVGITVFKSLLKKKKKLIEVEPIYNVLSIQQSDSVIYIFQILVHAPAVEVQSS